MHKYIQQKFGFELTYARNTESRNENINAK